jgi:hypothetical protein
MSSGALRVIVDNLINNSTTKFPHNNPQIKRVQLLLPNLIPIVHITQEIYCPGFEARTVHHP